MKSNCIQLKSNGIKGHADEWLNVHSKQSENACVFTTVIENLNLLINM